MLTTDRYATRSATTSAPRAGSDLAASRSSWWTARSAPPAPSRRRPCSTCCARAGQARPPLSGRRGRRHLRRRRLLARRARDRAVAGRSLGDDAGHGLRRPTRTLRPHRQARRRHRRLAWHRADDRPRPAPGRASSVISSRKADAVRRRRPSSPSSGLQRDPRGHLDRRGRAALAAARARALRAGWTCWSTTPAPPGARRSRSSRPRAGTRSCDTNVEGVFRLTVALLPALRAAATPRIRRA